MLVVMLIILAAFAVIAFAYSENKKYVEKVSNMSGSSKQCEMLRLSTQVNKHKTSHLLHCFLCFLSFGFWIPAWMFVTISNNNKQKKAEKLMNVVIESN